MQTAKDIISWLALSPNELEGGYFRSTYVSSINMVDSSFPGFPPTDKNGRAVSSAIYYFLDASGVSVMHRVTGDMVYHFYTGDPVQMLLLYPDKFPDRTEVITLSNDLSTGALPQKVIPGGSWIGSRLIAGGHYALMGVTMSPGFHPNDYSIGSRNELIDKYPKQTELITLLTRNQ